MQVIGDQLHETFLVMMGHVGGNVHTALMHEVATMVMQLFEDVVLFRHRLEFNHRHVATLGEIAFLVEHIGDTA